MYDFTTEDRYLIEQGDQWKKKKRLKVFFSFLPKIEVLSRTSLEVLQDILVLTRGMWNLATGVQLNGCAALWVCS